MTTSLLSDMKFTGHSKEEVIGPPSVKRKGLKRLVHLCTLRKKLKEGTGEVSDLQAHTKRGNSAFQNPLEKRVRNLNLRINKKIVLGRKTSKLIGPHNLVVHHQNISTWVKMKDEEMGCWSYITNPLELRVEGLGRKEVLGTENTPPRGGCISL